MKITKQLILDHFDRKTSPMQRERIAEWVKEEANEEQYYEWLEEWERGHLQYDAPTDPAMNRFLQFVDAHPQPEPLVVAEESAVESSGNRRIWTRWTVAATVLLLLGLGGWLFRDDILYQNYRTAYGEVKSFTLGDGSAVKLNTNSALRVPRWSFGRDTREVFLEGEGSFSVTHTADDREFIVHTPRDLDVVVLGTEFTLYAREHNSRVVLEKGKVRVQYREAEQQKEITMQPGDLVTLNRDNEAKLSTTQQAKQYSEWEEMRFVFEETTLEELAYQLRDDYGLDVTVEGEALARREFMGSFKAKDVDELLLTLSELLDIRVTRQGDKVSFSEKR
ncbi:FecR family protein [Persicitalea jodogahamensis]|uniref:DUF4974 domain-containing protein n=1 Tax=Persicitalea jodogahamensis TaxID=402147 RepID=A0A8J3DDT2_9BACT|nr:FecR domain-containing protein [Persicitalea jodogahamensis]GHB87037.1 hypothetical protein GCM10007390_48600 [Persicitalea jodogahamensis]